MSIEWRKTQEAKVGVHRMGGTQEAKVGVQQMELFAGV